MLTTNGDRNWLEIAGYVAILSKPREAYQMNAINLIPKRICLKGTKPGITNQSVLAPYIDDDDHWVFSKKAFTNDEKKLLLGAALELGTQAIFNNHIYTFGGKFFLWRGGGKLFRVACCRIRMAVWARILLNFLKDSNM